jgi:hypothetical protein
MMVTVFMDKARNAENSGGDESVRQLALAISYSLLAIR